MANRTAGCSLSRWHIACSIPIMKHEAPWYEILSALAVLAYVVLVLRLVSLLVAGAL